MGVVHHAEMLAYKLGEPYGTMILTFSAVTVEIIMIATFMLHDSNDPKLGRDTIYSTLMILLNGLTGLVMLLGGLKYGEQKYNLKSTNSFFSMIFGVVGLGLMMPIIIPDQLKFAYGIFLIVICLVLYIFFIRMQGKEHNFYFKFNYDKKNSSDEESFPPKDKIKISYNVVMLVLLIFVISLLAEYLSFFIDDGIDLLGFPTSIGGLVVALIIVSPEGLTAIRAGLKNDMQRVINISLGSMLSTVSLTIPAVLLIGIITQKEVVLALEPIQAGIVIISLLVGILSCKDGETNALQGFIHVILFITFIFLSLVM